jgi:hypothetical protein
VGSIALTKVDYCFTRRAVARGDDYMGFDILGQEVATLINEVKPAGRYVVDFNASTLSSGVYLYQLQSGERISTKRMLVVK